jgi:hypothetical protein
MEALFRNSLRVGIGDGQYPDQANIVLAFSAGPTYTPEVASKEPGYYFPFAKSVLCDPASTFRLVRNKRRRYNRKRS